MTGILIGVAITLVVVIFGIYKFAKHNKKLTQPIIDEAKKNLKDKIDSKF